MNQPTDFETRQQIFRLLSEHPGLNLSDLSKMLNISTPLAMYHLHRLEKQGLLSVERKLGYPRYYPVGEISTVDRKILALLRRENPLRIILFLLEHPHSSHKKILEQIPVAKSTLSYHLENLVKREILTRTRVGTEQHYEITDEQQILQILMRYKPSRVFKGIKETWVDFSIRRKKR